MKKIIALLLAGIMPLMASASGIGGGGSGVHGVGTRLPANIGVGTAPKVWESGNSAIDIGTATAVRDNGSSMGSIFAFNAYRDASSTWVYKNTGYSSLVNLAAAGQIIFDVAGSGTAGSAITFSPVITISNDGTVTSSKSCASGYTRLTPNYCYFNNGHAGTVLGTGTSGTVACPSGATAVMVNLDGKTGSTVGAASSDNLHAHQFVQVSSDYAQGIVPCNAGNWYWVSTLSSALNYVVLGYFD